MKDFLAAKQALFEGLKLDNTQGQLAKSQISVAQPGVQNQLASLPQNFIKGELIENQDGATYEGIVYDRRLRLRFPNGGELTVFDFLTPSRESLPVNEIDEMVLCPLVTAVDLVAGSTSPAEPELGLRGSRWQGLVVDLEWEAPSGAFRFVYKELYVRSWALVATPLGYLILSSRSIREPLQVGTVIEWECTMPYLYAVV